MPRTVALLLVLLTATPGWASEPPEREARQSLVVRASTAQITSTRVVRSKSRMAIGGWMVLAGAFSMVHAFTQCAVVGSDAHLYSPPLRAEYDMQAAECVLEEWPDSRAPDVFAERDIEQRFLWGGLGVATAGLLLATVWSDVTVSPDVAVGVSRGGLQIQKRFRW